MHAEIKRKHLAQEGIFSSPYKRWKFLTPARAVHDFQTIGPGSDLSGMHASQGSVVPPTLQLQALGKSDRRCSGSVDNARARPASKTFNAYIRRRENASWADASVYPIASECLWCYFISIYGLPRERIAS